MNKPRVTIVQLSDSGSHVFTYLNDIDVWEYQYVGNHLVSRTDLNGEQKKSFYTLFFFFFVLSCPITAR